jgi:hypothetical protein
MDDDRRVVKICLKFMVNLIVLAQVGTRRRLGHGADRDSLLYGRQGIDQRTSGIFASVTTPDRIRQNALHRSEIGDLRPNVFKVMGRKIANFGASFLPAVGRQRQQCPHFIETETQLARPSHECQAANVVAIVKPIPRGATRRVRQQADALVIPDRFDVAAGAMREVSNPNFWPTRTLSE